MTNDKLGLETKPTASQLAPKHPLPSYIGARTIVGKNGERGPARRVPLPSVPPPYAQRKDALPPLHHTTQAPSTKRPPVGLSRPPPPKRRADESEVATPPERRVWPLTQHAMARHNAEATKEAEPAPAPPPPTPAWVIKPSATGLGMYATAALYATDIILTEKPLLMTRRGATPGDVRAQLRTVPSENWLELLNLCVGVGDGEPRAAIECLLDTNGIPCASEDGENPPYGIFKAASRINHSCAPNAGWYWCGVKKALLVVAYRKIKKGEEITASYLPPEALCSSRAERRERIQLGFGFECGCAVCGVTSSKDSDAQRAIIARVLSAGKHMDPWVSGHLASVRGLKAAIEAMRTEALWPLAAELRMLQYYVHAAWREDAHAQEAAKKALAALAALRGWRAARTHFVAQFVKDVTCWASYGVCKLAPK